MMKNTAGTGRSIGKEERTSAGESCIVRDCTAKNRHQRSGKLPGTGRKWSDRNIGGTQTARWKHEIHQQPGDSRRKCKESAQALAKQGKTPLLFAKDDVLIGMIAVADVIKEDSPKAVQELQNMGNPGRYADRGQ